MYGFDGCGIRRGLMLVVLTLVVSGCASLSKEPPVKFPNKIEQIQYALPVGEHMQFGIRWLGFEVGRVDVLVKEMTKIRDRDAYHIVVTVRSNRLISLIYPVRDEHHSYIDAEHFHSLRYEKVLREGKYRADEVIDYDQVNHKARYESRRSKTIKEMLIPVDVQDQLSCTFWFRFQLMKPGDQVRIPVNADEKNWDLEVKVLEWEKLDTDVFGPLIAVKVEPLARFHGLFVRRGRAWGWMSTDERRVPLLMETQIPILGSIQMVMTDYKIDKQDAA